MTDYKAIKVVLSNLAYFSQVVLRFPLYDYQLRPALAVVDSVLNQHGLEFLFVYPRQSGKNEAVAQLLVYLLNLLQRRGGQMVYGATGDGLGRGISRLEARLDNPLNRGYWRKAARPVRRLLGKASVVFLSTHPNAATRGETADWLLVIDEFQDQVASHIEAVFEPMRAANNATALYIGTVKTTTDALWQKKAELLAEQENDGLKRVYVVSPDAVVVDNPAYGRFLENKIRRLGRQHPIVASEYFNEPVAGDGRLFDRRRQQLMCGGQNRQTMPDPAKTYVATLDVGGLDEAATDPLAQLANPGRDYTVAHIFEVNQAAKSEPGPTYRAMDIFVDQGSRHFQGTVGRANLAERLLVWLGHWYILHLVADQSGVGAGLVDWLAAKLDPGRVTGFTFSAASKAALGADFLSVVETGRFRYWQTGLDRPLSDAWWFFSQVQACTYALAPGARFEKDLRWGVPAEATIDTPAGPQPVHDDRLISAALVAVYDGLFRQGKLRLGRAESAIIPPCDPLADTSF